MIVLASFILLLAAASAGLVVLSCRRMLPWSALPLERRRAGQMLSGVAILCPVVGLVLALRQWPPAASGMVIPWMAVGMTFNAASLGVRSRKRALGA